MTEPSPDMKKAIRRVQSGIAASQTRNAMKAVRKALEASGDVAVVLTDRAALQVTMMNGVVLRIERLN